MIGPPRAENAANFFGSSDRKRSRPALLGILPHSLQSALLFLCIADQCFDDSQKPVDSPESWGGPPVHFEAPEGTTGNFARPGGCTRGLILTRGLKVPSLCLP